MKSTEILLPLIEILLSRGSFVMKRLFHIGVEIMRKDANQRGEFWIKKKKKKKFSDDPYQGWVC